MVAVFAAIMGPSLHSYPDNALKQDTREEFDTKLYQVRMKAIAMLKKKLAEKEAELQKSVDERSNGWRKRFVRFVNFAGGDSFAGVRTRLAKPKSVFLFE